MIRETCISDAVGLVWFKSSYSDSSNPNDCVEVAVTSSAAHVRDSKDTSGPTLTVGSAAWSGFVAYASSR
ncbi:DUF397 domain-containing protein [Streptomyces sp. GC420]|uniref:DUF397 domain-containing protein n=1 Tax=Streptomyces sp. GC420 TaxID=2697568 RepID=UPI0014151B32|nr:DUF397 domain-containing protein [Streptomyces sp. GC420]NBM15271.1 DUF397 domain-containing protein [Streptomyces sp. GC420]